MQINRLFEIVYILLDRKIVTAKELSEHFLVSTRTIYRDVETLSVSGIPIYMTKGKGGGISLLDNFVLNKSMLTENEQIEILSALHGLNSLNFPDAQSILDKLGTLFNKHATNWIDIDFSYWWSDSKEKEKFDILKTSILSKHIITFDYFAPNREEAKRIVEPLQLYFKEKAWYLNAFCSEKQDYRTFKITRMKDIKVTNLSYSRELKKNKKEQFPIIKTIKFILKFKKSCWGRFFDEIDQPNILKKNEEYLIAEFFWPEDEWLYSFILSYAPNLEVLEPLHVRKIIKQKLEENLNLYL